MHKLIDPLHEAHLRLLLEPLHYHCLDVLSDPNQWPCNASLSVRNIWNSHSDRSGLYGGWSNTIQHMECSVSWTVQASWDTLLCKHNDMSRSLNTSISGPVWMHYVPGTLASNHLYFLLDLTHPFCFTAYGRLLIFHAHNHIFTSNAETGFHSNNPHISFHSKRVFLKITGILLSGVLNPVFLMNGITFDH
jgi:hypothetical protein